MNEETFKKQSKQALAQCKIINNNDRTIDIIGDLIVKFPFKYLPKIKKLKGDFDCSLNATIKSLEGSPFKVTGLFEKH